MRSLEWRKAKFEVGMSERNEESVPPACSLPVDTIPFRLINSITHRLKN